MKTKSYSVRLNLEVASERNLYDLLKADSKNYRSEAECIKTRLTDYYSNKNDGLEDIILRTQKELLEKMYDTCLKIIGSVSGIRVNYDTSVKNTEGTALPKTSDKFPDGLNDVLDFLA